MTGESRETGWELWKIPDKTSSFLNVLICKLMIKTLTGVLHAFVVFAMDEQL